MPFVPISLRAAAALIVALPFVAQRVWFAMAFMATLIILYVTLPFVSMVAPTGAQYRWAMDWAHVAFNALFGSCPWLRFRNVPTEEDWRRLCPDVFNGKGAIVMVNHTSFADGFFFAALAPRRVLRKSRALMKGGFFSTPVVGSVFSRLGFLPVYFKSDDNLNSFSVDKERQAPVTAVVEEHLQAGGVLVVCPEGGINRQDPTQLRTFRRGTFQTAIKMRVSIYCLNTLFNYHFWPTNRGIGGYPATILCDLCAVDEWNRVLQGPADAVDAVDGDALSNMAQVAAQASLDKLIKLGDELGLSQVPTTKAK